jgi:hypothetical protein
VDLRSPLPALHRFITSGGTIDVGRIEILDCAAVASDAQTLWVALTRRPGEMLTELLTRLNDALKNCLAHGESIDELEREPR